MNAIRRIARRAFSLLLCLLLCLTLLPAAPASAAGDVEINETNFPDANFRSYVSDNFDKDADGKLSEAEIAAIVVINCASMSISSLSGVEFFTALIMLDCSSNQLTAIDPSHNTALQMLSCSENRLTTLNVSKNSDLRRLDCDSNQLTSLNLSQNAALLTLSCSENRLTTLDLSENTALTLLDCFSNGLTTLDLSKNTLRMK